VAEDRKESYDHFGHTKAEYEYEYFLPKGGGIFTEHQSITVDWEPGVE